MADIFRIDDLNFNYFGKEKMFDNISLSIKNNSLNALLGPDNCGKTTLIEILSGKIFLPGVIKCNNHVINKKNIETYRNNVSIVYLSEKRKLKFNKFGLLLKYQLRRHSYSLKQVNEKMLYFNELFDIKNLLNKDIYKMSEMDRVKALIISSIIFEPKVLFIDDLNEDYGFIFELLNKIISEFNISIIFTTRNLDICKHCNNIYFLNCGKIVLSGDYNHICSHDNLLSRNGIIISPMLDLSLKLKDYNLLDTVIMDPVRLVDKLWN